MSSSTKLPDKKSELILLALRDLEACEKEPETYLIEMLCWHDPGNLSGKCRVCLAGSVMAKSLHISDQAYADPWCKMYFDYDTGAKLLFLDNTRTGLECGGVRYHCHPELFKEELRRIAANYLKEESACAS